MPPVEALRHHCLWYLIWKTPVPPIKVFDWKLASHSLVQMNLCRCFMEVLPTCSICGIEPEDGFHAIMACTKARALRTSLRAKWRLSPEDDLKYIGDDRVLILLDRFAEDCRTKLLFYWWRAWHLCNDVFFGKGDASIEASAQYLFKYADILSGLSQLNHPAISKGKNVLDGRPRPPHATTMNRVQERLTPPVASSLKINVHSSFFSADNSAAWGAVLRDHRDTVLGSAWNLIDHCPDAETAEATACLSGVQSLCRFSSLPIIVRV